LGYLGLAICGGEGRISDTPNGQEIPDYRPDLKGNLVFIIYIGILEFLSPLLLEPRWVDVDMMDDRVSYISAQTFLPGRFQAGYNRL
jgi:hypothetical protein